MKVKCPTCRKEGEWFNGEFGPFCSRRCKLIDLGQWLEESNRISGPLTLDHLEDLENTPVEPASDPDERDPD
jgi:hypothetical protein